MNALNLDPDVSTLIGLFGKKGSGKSNAAELVFESWPYDRVVVDITGSIGCREGWTRIEVPYPAQLPEPAEGEQRITAYVCPDPGSATYFDDLDAAVGLALFPQTNKTLIWIDEIGALKEGPHLRRLLQMSRHHRVSALFCGPRTKTIPVLVIAQCDLIFLFRMPSPDDRIRVADTVGMEPRAFEANVAQAWARGRFCFALYDARPGQERLYAMPPLPDAAAARTNHPVDFPDSP